MAAREAEAEDGYSPLERVKAALIGYGPLVLALVFGMLLLRRTTLVWRKPKVQTWRICNIPFDVREDELRASLESLAYPRSRKWRGVSEKPSNIRQFSFVKALSKSSTATVTFWRTPFILKTQLSELRVSLYLDRLQVEVVFDTHFYGMTTLYHPPDPVVDLIAVTGLAGHGLGSWKSPGSTDVWIRDYLSADKLNARVLTYGYDTTLVRSKSKSSIHDLAMAFLEALKSSRKEKAESRRPIIIIAHSLGGLLVKEALVITGKPVNSQSHIGSRENLELCKCCYALVFFGVPNLGIQQETLMTLLRGQPNYPLIKSVVMDNDAEPSDYLKSLNSSFLESFLFSDSPVISYYEKLVTETVKINWLGQLTRTGESKLLVSEASATNVSRNKNLGDQHPIQANHSQMVKFKHRSHQDYIDLLRQLESLVEQASMVIRKRFPRNEDILLLCKKISERFDPLRIMTSRPIISYSSLDDGLPDTFELHEWLSDKNSPFIWFVRRPQLGETTCSQIVRDMVNAKTVCVYCVQFSQSPGGEQILSNTADMILRYILARIICIDSSLLENFPTDGHENLLNLLDVHHNFDKQRAWDILERLMKTKRDVAVRIVIDGLEKIHPEEDRNDFVNGLRRLLESQVSNMKILVTSVPYEPIRAAFQGRRFIDPITEYHNCLKSLSTDAYNHRQETIVPAEEYTGAWIMEHPKYMEWDSTSHSSTLWLVGKAGSGKSTLLLATLKRLLLMYDLKDLAEMLGRVPRPSAKSSRRAEIVPLETSAGEKPIVAAFFYRFRTFLGEKTEASHVHMLYSLLFQILKQDVRLFPLFHQAYRNITPDFSGPKNDSRSWSFEDLLEIFTTLVNMKPFSRRIYIILDALDESDNDSARTKVLRSITDACHSRRDGVVMKVIIASRPNGQLVGDVEEREKIIMQNENAKDITRIVAAGLMPIRSGVDRLSRDERANFDIERFRRLLLTQANGVIIWVSLVLKQVQGMIARGLTPRAMMEELENMQPDIEELYATIVRRLKTASQADIDRGKKWLELVSFTERSLNVREFQDAELILRLGSDTPRTEKELKRERLPISNLGMVEQYLMSICGGFIEVKTWSRISTATGVMIITSHLEKFAHDGGLQLLHRSVRDFITKEKSAPYQTDILEGNRLIIKICIQYLGLSLMDLHISADVPPKNCEKSIHDWQLSDYELFVKNLNKWPLLEYALKFLPVHLERLRPSHYADLDQMTKVIHQIRASSSSAGFLLLCSWFDKCATKENQNTPSKGKNVRRSGEQMLVQLWTQFSSDDEFSKEKEFAFRFVTTSLVTSSRNSCTWAVKSLLAAGALANVSDDVNGSSALKAAAESGSSEIITQLTQEDTQINQLHSQFDISRLKDSPDSIDYQNSSSTSPVEQFDSGKDQALLTAARQGNAVNVSLFLENGAEPDSRDELGASPISLACSCGAEDVVSLLIGAGADFDSKDFGGLTPLMIAASKGHIRVVQLLLQAGANPNCADRDGKSPLSLALAGNHEDIIQMLLEAGAIGDVSKQSVKTLFLVPSGGPYLIGREEVIHQLEENFQNASEHCRVSLVGMGGVGKTQIAFEYAYLLRKSHPNTSVFWVHGSSFHQFEQGYMQIAKRANIPGVEDPKVDILRLVCTWLESSASGSWFMVLDNAEDTDLYLRSIEKSQLSLASYLPRNLNGNIVLTTRNRQLATKLTDKVISVDILTPEEAAYMLYRVSGQKFGKVAPTELLQRLGHLPLAISLAAAFMTNNRLTISEYSSMLEQNESTGDLLFSSLLPDSGGNQVPNSILKTFQISFDLLRKRHPESARILYTMSFLDPDGIPYTLLEDEYIDNEHTEERLSTLLAPLKDLSLITTYENSSIYIHKLVQRSLRRTMSEADTMKFADEALQMLSSRFPKGDFEDWITCALLYPHAKALINFSHIDETDAAQLSSLCHNTARYLHGRGYYWPARENSERAYHIRRKVFGPESILTLASLNLLATALQSLGEYNSAQILYEQVSKEVEEQLGPDDTRTISTIDHLANIYRNQGHLEEAIQLYNRVLRSKQNQSSHNFDALRIMQNLAATYRAKGQYTDAERFFKQALVGREELLGEMHPDTLTTVASLADTYWAQGKLNEAIQLYNRAIGGSEKALGSEHPDVLGMRENLAMVYGDKAQYVEAAAILEDVLSGMERQLGSDHPDTLKAMINLAVLQQNQGRLLEAERLLRLALPQQEKVLGVEHPTTLNVVDNLASVSESQGRYEEAEQLYNRSLKGREKVLGAQHPDTLSTIDNLASVAQNQRRYEEAEQLYNRSLEGRENWLGPEHPDTLSTIGNLAIVLENQGRFREAEQLYKRSLEGREKVLGPEHPDTLRTIGNLAIVLQNQGLLREAEQLYKRSLEGREKVLGPEHPDTLNAIDSLASIFEIEGRFEDAEDLFTRLLRAKEKVLGPEHLDTLNAVDSLAGLCESQGRYSQAERLYIRSLREKEKILGSRHPETLATRAKLNLLGDKVAYREPREARRHRYTDIKISAQSRVHLGDTYGGRGIFG